MPSSSPRCAQFPRAQDKVHFYIKLKELRDQMKGAAPGSDVQETQYSFDLHLAKGKQPSPSPVPVGLTFSRLQCCFCLQKMPRGWPSKRSRKILSMRAAAGSSASTPPKLGRRTAGGHMYTEIGQHSLMMNLHLHRATDWESCYSVCHCLLADACGIVSFNVFVLQLWPIQQKHLF